MKLNAVKWGGALLLILCLMAGSAWAAWEWQANACGQQIAEQKAAHQTALTDVANANSVLILAEQNKRFALEQWLAASEKAHYRALTDEKTKQARLRDRLATADLRLSVLLDTTATNDRDGMQATTGPGGVVHGSRRAQLDRAHAQRIIGITSDGDRGLIALQACQSYLEGQSRFHPK
ncbi:lysis protein [Pseudomonas lundensis]|uniref:lysis protein n=1 Tax=Pseudomonas lundensis TaxID=86185 RepID=UPI00390832A3